jgi:tRNA-dihydrouridine synthase B
MIPSSFKIRELTIRPAAVLAPMAGVTDTLFRRVIRGLGGCGLLMTEFTSSEGITRSAKKTLRYLYFQEDEHPITAQLFGANPAVMAEAAKMVEDLGYDAEVRRLGAVARFAAARRNFSRGARSREDSADHQAARGLG